MSLKWGLKEKHMYKIKNVFINESETKNNSDEMKYRGPDYMRGPENFPMAHVQKHCICIVVCMCSNILIEWLFLWGQNEPMCKAF